MSHHGNGNNGFESIILNCISDGVLTIDLNGRVQYVNKAMRDLLGYEENEPILGLDCDALVRSRICHSADCILRRTLEKREKVSNFETTLKSRSGKTVSVNINTDFLRDDEGNLIGIVEVFRDISIIKALQEKLEDKYHFGNIVAKNHRMKEILQVLPMVAASKSTVLIEGESGTGKELIARAIHNNSPRKDKAFIAVNCAAIAEGVLESELFGHVKGAFTGAYQDRPGRFQLANGGTIFLDEIGDMSQAIQGKVLRFLQEEEFERVGEMKTIKVDVRVIAATNRDLLRATREGDFREDLYYRIRVFPVKLPALRERKDDIPILVSHFIEKFNLEMGRSINNISPRTMELLMNHHYPGNIRELENIIEHAFVCCPGNTILPEHLPKDLFSENKMNWMGNLGIHEGSLEKMEKEFIANMLDQSHWKLQEVSRKLGISRTTLWRKIKSYGLERRQKAV
jgi:PAS domain S-box-containing protein